MVPPPLPLLKGQDDLEIWVPVLIQTFRYWGIEEYLFKDSTEISKTVQNKAFGMILMTNSVAPVMSELRNAGWSVDKTDQDPKDLYDLILKVIPDVPDFDSAVDEFNNLDVNDHATLSDFQFEAQRLRNKVQLGEDHPEIETWGVRDVVMALKEGREVFHYSLMGEMIAGRLTWTRLMKKIDAQIAHERTVSMQEDDDDHNLLGDWGVEVEHEDSEGSPEAPW
jgi:hypothetical protein